MTARLPIALLAAALSLSIWASTDPAAAAGTVVTVSPATPTVDQHDVFTLDIAIAEAANVGGYVIAVAFDPAVLQLQDLADAGWLDGGDNVVYCSDAPTIDHAAGTAFTYCQTLLAFGIGVSTGDDPAMLAQATFKAIGAGTSAVSLEGSHLHDPQNITMDATFIGAEVSVTAAPTPTRTVTRTPTRTPSATPTRTSTPSPAPSLTPLPTAAPPSASATATPPPASAAHARQSAPPANPSPSATSVGSTSTPAVSVLGASSTKPAATALSPAEDLPDADASRNGSITWWVLTGGAAIATVIAGGGWWWRTRRGSNGAARI